ncbi:MAG TPA: tetratricopeptide repeat protein [Nitrospirota bacterium]|nr:tetratricopeptide repeat protein [Nitrospirota bacterium]
MKKTWTKYYTLAASIAVLTVLVYLPAVENGFVYDDYYYVVDNDKIRSINTSFIHWAFFEFSSSNWHPLTWMSHAVDYTLWTLNPIGHHLTSIFLHGLNSFLVVILGMKLLESARDSIRIKGKHDFLNAQTIGIAGAVSGIFFGLHPLHVESVAWVAERKDVLCALFYLLSVLQYERYVKAVKNTIEPPEALSAILHRRLLAALGFFFLALLSKPMAVTLPLVLIILDWYPFARIDSRKTLLSALIEKLPFFVLSLASSLVTLLAQSAGMSVKSIESAPLTIRLLVIAKAYFSYLAKMIVPIHLLPMYPYPQSATMLSAEYFLPIIFTIGVTAACIAVVRRQKVWLATWGYYLLTLIPVIGIVQVGEQAMADRYSYLPSLGPFLVAGLVVAWISNKAWVSAGPYQAKNIVPIVIACVMATVLSFLTVKQTRLWNNDIDLWSSVIERGQPSFVSYFNRGAAYLSTGRPERAIADFDNAIALRHNWWLVYDHRGLAYAEMSRFDMALADYNKAIMLNNKVPRPYRSRGFVYLKAGRMELAVEDFRKACELGDVYACGFVQIQ